MLFFDQDFSTISIDSINSPVLSTHFYTLDLSEDVLDFMLTPLQMLEESTGKTLTIEINGYLFNIPASWNTLIFSPETSQIDCVKISDLSVVNLPLLSYGFEEIRIKQASYKIVDFHESKTVVSPFIGKKQMLCHPISQNLWVCLSPHNVYKLVKNLTISELT